MSFRQKLLIYILSLVLMYAVYYWGIPLAFNVPKNIDNYEKIILDKTGYNIDISNPNLKMGLFPSIWFSADNFNLINNDSTYALSIEKPKIEISVFRFLTGKCNINYFSADDIIANLTYTKDNQLYLGSYLIPKSDKQPIDIQNIKLNIQELKVNINDKSLNKFHVINADYIIIDKFIKNKQYKLSSDIDLTLENSTSNLNFEVNLKMPFFKNLSNKNSYASVMITNFDLSCLSKYVSYLTNNEYNDLKGKLNFETHSEKLSNKTLQYNTNFILENFGINGNDFALPYYYNGKITASSKLSAKKKNLLINELTFNTDNLNAEIKGRIDKITSKNPILNINISSKNSRAEKIVELLPANNKYFEDLEFDIETLVKAKFFADVNMDLNITGNTVTPNVNGDLKITNAYVTEKPISNGAKKADINLHFKDDKIILDVFVPAAVNQYVTVGGDIELYGKKDVDIIIKSTKSVDLGIAQYVLMPVHKVLNFDLGPVPIMDIKGLGNIDLNVKGNKYNPHAYGVFNFNNGTVSFIDVHNMVLKNASGSLKFDDRNTIFTTKSATLFDKPISVNGTCTLFGVLNFDVETKHQPAKELLKILKTSPMLVDIGGKLNQLEVESGLADVKFKLNGKVLNTYDIILGKNIFAAGSVKLHNITSLIPDLKLHISNISGNIDFDNLNLKLFLESAINNSVLKIKGEINDDLANIKINSDNMSVDDIISTFSNGKLLPINKNAPNRKSLISFSADYSGSINKFDYSKFKADGFVNFNNYSLMYKPTNSYCEIINGNFTIKNEDLNLNNINLKIDSMPLFISGKINNLSNVPYYNIYLNLKPNQTFIDNIYNRKFVYPIKVRGNINQNMTINGTQDNFNIKSTMNLDANSKIYYMGGTFGDDINPIILNMDADVRNKNTILVKNISKDVLLKTNNNRMRLSRELYVTGGLKLLKDDIVFNNFVIKTMADNDARFFNMLFRRPLIKQGTFSSDIKINGNLLNPKIIGNLIVRRISIPDYLFNLKYANFNFNQRIASISAEGDIFNEKFKLSTIMENKFIPPLSVNELKLRVNNLNISSIVSHIREIEINSNEQIINSPKSAKLVIPDIFIKTAKFEADSILVNRFLLNNITATANFDKNKVLNISDFRFLAANGIIKGNYSLNTINAVNNMSVVIDNVDSGELTDKILNLKNQISGKLNGEMDFSCKGYTQDDCVKTVSGHGGFKIIDGKMPKLGSMEYLLNAANLVKGGITNLSFNGLIDLITPLRTGEFESIIGTLDLKNGKFNDIQIYSQGKNLNLFIVGNVDIETSVANMKIFGRLLRNTSSVLGPIGNASLNALFNTIPWINLSEDSDNSIVENINKIPGIELSNNKYRIFTVDINGDINGNDDVRSFKWVE